MESLQASTYTHVHTTTTTTITRGRTDMSSIVGKSMHLKCGRGSRLVQEDLGQRGQEGARRAALEDVVHVIRQQQHHAELLERTHLHITRDPEPLQQ